MNHPSEKTEQILLSTEKFSVVHLPEPDGRPELSRTVIRHPGAVVILPILDDGQVCLIRNRRVSVNKTLLEMPAGTCESGESIEATARRELTEETGFVAEQMGHIHSYFAAPGILDEEMHFFVAEGLATASKNLMEDEEIENEIMPLQDAYHLVENREIVDAKTIVGLLFYRCFVGDEISNE